MNDLLLLAIILDGPKYGYQLKREAGWIAGQDNLHSNLVYPLLRKFLGQKWVTMKTVPGERGQTRRQYSLTAAGRQNLFERLNAFSEADAASESAFHLRVGIFPALQPQARETVLARRDAYLQKRGLKLEALEASIRVGKFGGEVVGYMRKQIDMERAWIRHLQRTTKALNRRRKR
ncbi:MAG TPA: PadR family transcriptional regulator [Candidatus Sulfotelmatobacter sp.]|jgi:DNA-binding PadR family transcriptional regulator